MKTLCAYACESHYHNLQPIKKSLRNAASMVLITMALWGGKKTPAPTKTAHTEEVEQRELVEKAGRHSIWSLLCG